MLAAFVCAIISGVWTNPTSNNINKGYQLRRAADIIFLICVLCIFALAFLLFSKSRTKRTKNGSNPRPSPSRHPTSSHQNYLRSRSSIPFHSQQSQDEIHGYTSDYCSSRISFQLQFIRFVGLKLKRCHLLRNGKSITRGRVTRRVLRVVNLDYRRRGECSGCATCREREDNVDEDQGDQLGC